MSEEEKTKLETLIELLYTDRLSQYGKRELVNYIEKQQKEIEEKTTIIMAGAEKVKQLEKGNRSLMESRIKWKNRYYKEKAKNKEKKAISQAIIRDTFSADYISKDEVREKIKELSKAQDFKVGLENYTIKILKELIGEK